MCIELAIMHLFTATTMTATATILCINFSTMILKCYDVSEVDSLVVHWQRLLVIMTAKISQKKHFINVTKHNDNYSYPCVAENRWTWCDKCNCMDNKNVALMSKSNNQMNTYFATGNKSYDRMFAIEKLMFSMGSGQKIEISLQK